MIKEDQIGLDRIGNDLRMTKLRKSRSTLGTLKLSQSLSYQLQKNTKNGAAMTSYFVTTIAACFYHLQIELSQTSNSMIAMRCW